MPFFRLARILFWMLPPLLAAPGCGSGDTTGLERHDLLGTWEATEYKLYDRGDPPREFDLLGTGGSATVVFTEDGSFALVLVGAEPAMMTGAWELESGHRLILTESGTTAGIPVDVSLWTTVLIVGSDAWTFDFGDGPEPAQLSALFVPD